MAALLRPTAHSVSDASRKPHHPIKKGGSLRSAISMQDDVIDERTALSLKILRAELKAMRDEDELMMKRLRKMDEDLQALQQLFFSGSPVDSTSAVDSSSSPFYFTEPLPRTASGSQDDSGGSTDTSELGESGASILLREYLVSPPGISCSSVEVDSVFGSPITRPFLQTTVESSSGAEETSAPSSPPSHIGQLGRPSFKLPTPHISQGQGSSQGTRMHSTSLDSVPPPASVTSLKVHKSLDFSPSFGESSFVRDLKSHALKGDDLIAMFNEKSDALKREMGLSQNSLASGSSGSETRTPTSRSENSSPYPPRATSCIELHSAPRSESPLVGGKPQGKAKRPLTKLSGSVPHIHGADSARLRPSPAGSPQQSYSPLNMKVLLGQHSPGLPRREAVDEDSVVVSHNTRAARGMTTYTSAGAVLPHYDSLLSSALGSDKASAQFRSHSFSTQSCSSPIDEHGAEVPLLSPLRRGSKAWSSEDVIQEEQFMRGRVVTSPPTLSGQHLQHSASTLPHDMYSEEAAEVSGTPSNFSQKHGRQTSAFLYSDKLLTADAAADAAGNQGEGLRSGTALHRSVSHVDGRPQAEDQNGSGMSEFAYLSRSSSSLASKKSAGSTTKFFTNFGRNGKKKRGPSN